MDIQSFSNNLHTIFNTTNPTTFQLIINSIPVHIYYKNIDGAYEWCNAAQAQTLQLKSEQEIIGRTDVDLPMSDKFARVLRKNDLSVIKFIQQRTIIEAGIVSNNRYAFLSQKTPVKNNKGIVVGLLGISIKCSQLTKQVGDIVNIQSSALILAENGRETIDLNSRAEALKIMHKDTGDFISLPLYLKLCLIQVSQGKTAKQIAQELMLTPRTVENYISKLKTLLGCASSKELICNYLPQIKY